jgi:uncharacterized glyoxalase superfamily protein PhnB
MRKNRKMNAHATVSGRTLVPTLRYRDVPAAIAWLCNAFGFEKHLVVTGEDDFIRYAQLTFGDGMVMVVPIEDTAFDQLMKQPEETGGAETQICYVSVDDVGAHYARAKAEGAEILLEIDPEDASGRGYSCRDVEGHIWNFGSYDPWQSSISADDDRDAHPRRRRRVRHFAGAGALFFAVVALGAAIGFSYSPIFDATTESAAASDTSELDAILQRERRAREVAERAAVEARDQLARERSARELAELTSKEAEARVARASVEQFGTRDNASAEAAERASEAVRERAQQAQREAEAARALLANEQKAREAAELTAKEARERATRERSAREAAEQTSRQARERVAKEKESRLRERQAAQQTMISTVLTNDKW